MLKLVLQGLAAHWECDTKVLLGANAKPASAASMRTIVKEEGTAVEYFHLFLTKHRPEPVTDVNVGVA